MEGELHVETTTLCCTEIIHTYLGFCEDGILLSFVPFEKKKLSPVVSEVLISVSILRDCRK